MRMPLIVYSRYSVSVFLEEIILGNYYIGDFRNMLPPIGSKYIDIL